MEISVLKIIITHHMVLDGQYSFFTGFMIVIIYFLVV